MKPNFVCLGFFKCGTTTLSELLRQHKDVYMPDIKEPIFFSEDEFYKKGERWYEERYYSRVKKQKLIGEVNPLLTAFSHSERICRYFDKNTKVIFVMRNPVEKAYSFFKMFLRNGNLHSEFTLSKQFDLKKSFEKYVLRNCASGKRVKNMVISQGEYFRVMSPYLDYFEPENIKFILFEEMVADPKKTFREVEDFLGLEHADYIDFNVETNEGHDIPQNQYYPILREKLTHLRYWTIRHTTAKADPWIMLIFGDILQVTFPTQRFTKYKQKIMNILHLPKKKGKKIPMSQRTRKVLEDYYREDKKKVEKLLGRNLDDLWFK